SEAFLTRLCEISGIGKWTAQYVAMRALGETDAFPAGDAALLRALDLTNPQELEQRSEAWRPWRAYATIYLWHSLGARAKPAPPTPRKRRLIAATREKETRVVGAGLRPARF
ncbi:MAG: hypothetical protein WA197_19955, partial [Candidatus Acidiferrales bacterium]